MTERTIALGGTGLVGEGLRAANADIDTVSSKVVDITDRSQVWEYLSDSDANTILLLSAYTNVDAAEAKPFEALKVNVEGTRNVIQAADRLGKHVIWTGTDMVYPADEKMPGPYSEDVVPPNTFAAGRIGAYALSKLLAEKIVLESGRHAVVRISFPFGNHDAPGDLVNKAIIMIGKGYALFGDQIITPTYIPDLQMAVEQISARRAAGVFHVAATRPTTLYELASYVASKAGIDKEIKRGYFDDIYGEEARKRSKAEGTNVSPRPKLGGLYADYTQQVLGITFHTWKEAVDDYFDKLSIA